MTCTDRCRLQSSAGNEALQCFIVDNCYHLCVYVAASFLARILLLRLNYITIVFLCFRQAAYPQYAYASLATVAFYRCDVI